jgi:hypothetical protein
MTSEEPRWPETIDDLRGRVIPAAQANASLLESAQEAWESSVVPRTSMNDLLFTNPGDEHPFTAWVRVSWADGIFEFQLARSRGLVTADRCFVENSQAVLSAFLHQLLAEAATS